MGLEERVVGGVLGLALGDALGAPFAGRRAAEIPSPIPVFELPWRGGPPGSTTDATAMVRNLVRSLSDHPGFDPNDVVRRHLEWFQTEPPAVEALTRRVLSRVAAGEDAVAAATALWEERGPEVSAGNGSVMYCAPLGFAYANRPEQLLELAPALSGLTHFDGRCKTAVLAVTFAAATLAKGEDGRTAVAGALREVEELEGGEELEYLVEEVGQARPVDGPDHGFCLFTAAMGLQAALADASFEDELGKAIALGGDTDTNGAVAGALLGARGGFGGLPDAWLDRLNDRGAIEEEARRLALSADRSLRTEATEEDATGSRTSANPDPTTGRSPPAARTPRRSR
jgi:ADP-ribosyl-[dinitrogen reductase] hydrolase